jgi:LmbE family N-acetylglucosaminyl deacetylase
MTIHQDLRLEELRLLAVLAHPDDESLGFGGTLAWYAAEGVGTYLVNGRPRRTGTVRLTRKVRRPGGSRPCS